MLSSDEVKHIAHLARIELTPDEQEKIGNDLSKILEYVNQLSALDTKDIAPLNGGIDLVQQTRSDEQTDAYKEELCNPETAACLVNAAPAKQDGYVKVKSVF